MSIRTEQDLGISVHYLEMSYWEQAVQLITGKKSIGEIVGINSEFIMDFSTHWSSQTFADSISDLNSSSSEAKLQLNRVKLWQSFIFARSLFIIPKLQPLGRNEESDKNTPDLLEWKLLEIFWMQHINEWNGNWV